MGRRSPFNKQQALADALDLFWSRGFASSSLKHLETVTDMHPGSLYYHFTNKEQLYIATLELYLEWFLRPRIDKHLVYKNSLDELKRFFTVGYRHGKEFKFRNCCFVVATSAELHLLPESATTLVQDSLTELHSVFLTYIKKTVSADKLSSEIQPERTASELLNLYLSTQLRARMQPNQHQLDEQVKQSLEHILHTGTN